MFRINRALLALALVAGLASVAVAQTAQPTQTPAAPATPTKWVAPVRGTADIQYIKPAIRVEKDGTIVTTFQVKNVSTGAIARLTIEEYWWDKNNSPVTGDKQFLKKPLMPGEVATVILRTPKNPNMQRNSYKFLHANGDIKPKEVKKF